MASPSTMQRACRQRSDRRGRQRETLGQVKAFPSNQPDTAGVEFGQDAEAVVLDFVNPAGPGGRLLGEARQARFVAPDPALQLTRDRHGR
jgi:hypothetical protein